MKWVGDEREDHPRIGRLPSPTVNVAAQRRRELAPEALRDTEKAEPAVWSRVVV